MYYVHVTTSFELEVVDRFSTIQRGSTGQIARFGMDHDTAYHVALRAMRAGLSVRVSTWEDLVAIYG